MHETNHRVNKNLKKGRENWPQLESVGCEFFCFRCISNSEEEKSQSFYSLFGSVHMKTLLFVSCFASHFCLHKPFVSQINVYSHGIVGRIRNNSAADFPSYAHNRTRRRSICCRFYLSVCIRLNFLSSFSIFFVRNL